MKLIKPCTEILTPVDTQEVYKTIEKVARTCYKSEDKITEAESLENTIGELVSKENILCSDSNPSIIKWTKSKDLEHHTFLANKKHVKDKCYHVQHVNSIDNRFERWVSGFYGIATKYLQNYLNWFIFVEKSKKSIQQVKDMAKEIVMNIDSKAEYYMIGEKYRKLVTSTVI